MLFRSVSQSRYGGSRFSYALVPPLDLGITWSIVNVCWFILHPQYAHFPPVLLKIAARFDFDIGIFR